MVRTSSKMTPLNKEAPNFNLINCLTEKTVSLLDIRSDIGTVVMFICNHCPYVKHILPELVLFAKKYISQGISFVAINSNDTDNYPEDSPKFMKEIALDLDFPFPYLFDATQEVAHSYQAACTPDFFVFNKEMKSVYRGQFDASRPGNNEPITGESLSEALDCLIEGKEISKDQKPSMGCNIKWKK